MKTNGRLLQSFLLAAALLHASTSEAQLTVTKIAAGGGDSLFVESDGSLWAMGYNDDGQLGNYTTNNVSAPEDVVGGAVYIGSAPPNVTAIAARDEHSFFMESDGSLWAMGDNHDGEFGNGTGNGNFNISDFPVEILSNQVTAIAAGGDHTLFIKRHGAGLHVTTELWVMGDNSYGQLGDSTTTPTNLPEMILSYTSPNIGEPVTGVAAGTSHSLFLKADGSLWAMGDNGNGQLGDGTTNDSHIPKEILPSGVTTIAAAGFLSLFVKSDGSLWAMGDNSEGALGNGTTTDIHAFAMVVPSNVTAIAAGAYHTLFLKSDGSLWGMGYDNAGELTGNSQNAVLTPELVVAGGVTAAAAGDSHSLFLTSDGSLWGMGDNEYGELGGYSSPFSPVQIVGPIVANGGFETGDFLGWSEGNWLLGTNFVSSDARYAHSGTYGVKMPPSSTSGGGCSQTLKTTPGANYLLSFWLNCDGLAPNEFAAAWNGTNLTDQLNLPNLGWTNFQFTVAATSSNTVLGFEFGDGGGYFGLDDISVTQLLQPVITGLSLTETNLVLNVFNGLAGKTYLTLMSTNLAQPFSQWRPVGTNVLSSTGNFNVILTYAAEGYAQQRFYILETPSYLTLQPP